MFAVPIRTLPAASLLLAPVAATQARASLYGRLGGSDGVASIANELVDRSSTDPKIGPHFKDSNLQRVKTKLAVMICDLSGGPCHYSGDNMKVTRAGHHISQADFYDLVNNLRSVLEAHHVDQGAVNRQFLPHVSVIRTGTSVRFPNRENVRHQVYSFSAPKSFPLKLYSGQPSEPVLFDKPGLVVLGCNIHDRMAGFVGIVDTPYFGKVNAAGRLSISLPPGQYRLRVWHSGLTVPVAAQDVPVQDSAVALRVPVSMDLSASTPAPWPE